MTMHTPGPWKVTEEIDRITGGEYIRPTKGNLSPIASIWDFNRTDRDQERQDNARLIAAAPEMLRLLRIVASATRTAKHLNPDEWTPLDDDGLKSLESIIQKAEGKP
jgi:hypothetical protein